MENLTSLFPENYKSAIREMYMSGKWTEMFLCLGQPVIFRDSEAEYTLLKNGGLYLMEKVKETKSDCHYVTKADLYEILQRATKSTPIAFGREIGQGYLTIEGGHRLGFAGELIHNEKKEENTHFKQITGMMLRIAREKRGCAKEVLPFLFEKKLLCNTLVIAPPGCGKTTFLRDCSRELSNGTDYMSGKKVVIIDERMEIAASVNGVAQFDVGMRTNIISGCKKEVGFVMAVRSLSPNVLIADEMGFQEESNALLYGIYSGCSVICSTHGSGIEEVRARNGLSPLFNEQIFKRFVILKKVANQYHASVYSNKGELLYE